MFSCIDHFWLLNRLQHRCSFLNRTLFCLNVLTTSFSHRCISDVIFPIPSRTEVAILDLKNNCVTITLTNKLKYKTYKHIAIRCNYKERNPAELSLRAQRRPSDAVKSAHALISSRKLRHFKPRDGEQIKDKTSNLAAKISRHLWHVITAFNSLKCVWSLFSAVCTLPVSSWFYTSPL